MPVANGEPHTDSSVTATPGKRKRSTQEEHLGVDANTSTTSRDKATLHENLRSLVGLLIKLVLPKNDPWSILANSVDLGMTLSFNFYPAPSPRPERSRARSAPKPPTTKKRPMCKSASSRVATTRCKNFWPILKRPPQPSSSAAKPSQMAPTLTAHP